MRIVALIGLTAIFVLAVRAIIPGGDKTSMEDRPYVESLKTTLPSEPRIADPRPVLAERSPPIPATQQRTNRSRPIQAAGTGEPSTPSVIADDVSDDQGGIHSRGTASAGAQDLALRPNADARRWRSDTGSQNEKTLAAVIAEEDRASKAESLRLTPPPLPDGPAHKDPSNTPDTMAEGPVPAIPTDVSPEIQAEDREIKKNSQGVSGTPNEVAASEPAVPAIPTDLPEAIKAEDRRIKAQSDDLDPETLD